MSTDIELNNELVFSAASGNAKSVELLLAATQETVYKIALRFCRMPEDAEEATQEILIKICTHLSKFRGESAFTTWAYRIAVNHLISMQRGQKQISVLSYDQYANIINQCPDSELPLTADYGVESDLLLREAATSCVSGMLLCLNKKQRIVFILGMMDISGTDAADILEITPANFRKQLSRTRAELKAFMQGQCGLVNPSAACKCDKKTRAFIDAGVVNPRNLKFSSSYIKGVEENIKKTAKNEQSWLDLFAISEDLTPPDLVSKIQNMFRHGLLSDS